MVRRAGRRLAATVVVPPGYVAYHVDLGPRTGHGITVDTAHVVASASTTRENFYVSMTRGRDSNIAYVVLDQPDDSHATRVVEDVSARTVLYGVLQHLGAELSAHQMIAAEQRPGRRSLNSRLNWRPSQPRPNMTGSSTSYGARDSARSSSARPSRRPRLVR